MNTKVAQISVAVLLVLILALAGLTAVPGAESNEIAWRCRTGYAECIPPGRPIPDLKLSLY